MALTLTNAKLYDGEPEVQHDLVSGMAVEPGTIRITAVQSDVAFPVAASIIPDDESQAYPGTPTLAAGGPPYNWDFEFEQIPDTGPDAILRIEEIKPDGTGATANVTLHILSTFEEEPGPQPIFIQIGGIPPGP